MSDKERENKVQGEGDYESAARYQKDLHEAAKKTKDIENKAREAEPKSPAEEAELERAEDEGKSHAKQ